MSILVTFAILAAGPSMALPGPYWLFTLLHWLTLSMHMIAMNILVGGLLLLMISKTAVVRELLLPVLVKSFPTAMAATITLGVAPLLFLQIIYGKFFYSASIISGWNWFLIIPAVMVVYYLLYLISMKEKMSTPTKVELLTLVLIGFVYISYTFTMISDLAEKPGLWSDLYQSSPAGMSLNPSFGETIFRWLHMMAGALAVAGMSLQVFSLYHKKLKGNRDLLRFGGRMYMLGVIKAALFGLIYVFTLGMDTLKAFLASPGLHAIVGAIVLNIIALVLTFRAIKSERPHLKVWTSSILVFAGVFCMVIARHALRLVYLDGHFESAAMEINPQWSVFGVFIILFIGGLITLFWMIRKYFSASQTTS